MKKLLFGIQGTGNGHISRCIPIIEELKTQGYQVDILLSGISYELKLPFAVKYRKKGLSYVFGKEGGINLFQTLLRCNLARLIYEIIKCPVKQYDCVISDFEPIVAWASKIKRKKCIGFGNQYAAKVYPIKTESFQEKLGILFLNHFAPVKDSIKYDYLQNPHQNTYLPSFNLESLKEKSNSDHIVIYLPAHSLRSLKEIASQFPQKSFKAFCKWAKKELEPLPNLKISPICTSFKKEITNAQKVITAAGFGLTSELIGLQKDMLVIPMKNQVEQKINAAKLKKLGYSIIKNHRQFTIIEQWLLGKRTPQKLPHSTSAEITKKLIAIAS